MITEWFERIVGRTVDRILRQHKQEEINEKVYCYVFVRKDIPIWAQIVQVGHACIGAGEMFHGGFPRENVTLILLAVEDRNELDYAHRTAGCNGIRSFMFFETNQESLGGKICPDFTAMCTEPLDGEDWKDTFEDFDLWEAKVV